MRSYESEFERAMKLSQCTRVDKAGIAHELSNLWRQRPHYNAVAVSLVADDPVARDTAIQQVNQEYRQLTWEAAALCRGVEIYIEDKGLVECMLRTDIDAVMSDVRIPFPICEFIFPNGIALNDAGYEVSGCLICDASAFDVVGFWRSHIPELQYVSADHGKVTTSVFSRLICNGRSDSGVAWTHFNAAAGLPLNTLGIPAVEDMTAIHQLVRVVFGLCLYLQTREGYKALEPRAPSRADKFVSPALLPALRQRPKYRIRDMITAGFRSHTDSSPGTHASPTAHWRKLHLRSLRHERYERNPDGSVRVIWVKPSLIGAGDNDNVTGQRLLTQT